MSTQRVWYFHGLQFPTPAKSQVQIDGVVPAYNYQEVDARAASQVGPGFVGAVQASPDIRFTTQALKELLDVTTNYYICANLSVDATPDPYTLKLFCRSGQPMGVRELDASAEHRSIDLINSAFLYWDSFNASQGSPVDLSCMLKVAQQDPTQDPFVWSPAFTPPLPLVEQAPFLYTLGPVYIDDNTTFGPVNGVESVAWNNGIEPEERTSDGEVFPTLQAIRNYAPSAVVTTSNLTWLDSFRNSAPRTTRGWLAGSNGVVVYLRRMTPDFVLYDDTASQHIKITIPHALVTAREVNASPNMAVLNIRSFNVADDATGDVPQFTIDTASTIP